MQADDGDSSAAGGATDGNEREITASIDMIVGDPFGEIYEGLCQGDQVVSMLWAAEALVERLQGVAGVRSEMASELGHLKNVIKAAGEKLEGIVSMVARADDLLAVAGCRGQFRRVQ